MSEPLPKGEYMTHSAPTTARAGRNQRKLSNFLLQPWIQLKVAAWSAFAAAVFSLSIAATFYFSLSQIAGLVMEIGSLDDSTIESAYRVFENTRLAALGLLLSQVFVSIAVSVIMTHRLVGPTVAFRRQIRGMINGNTGQRVKLRSGDAFSEVADDLNELAEILDKTSNSGKLAASASEQKNAINQ